MFKSIRKLEPGCYLIANNGRVNIRQYWDLAFTSAEKKFDEAVEELEDLLSQTVRDHMISDVPVGVLLSGGVDSSGVLSFAVENTHRPISTFTVGFAGECEDERPFAKIAAAAFGAENYGISITAQQFWDFLPKYIWHMEEPVCEPPAIALYYVSRLAREHVTVLLSGEGGDAEGCGGEADRSGTGRREECHEREGDACAWVVTAVARGCAGGYGGEPGEAGAGEMVVLRSQFTVVSDQWSVIRGSS